VAIDENGRAFPTMLVYKSAWPGADWGHTKYTLVFPAENVPSLGYKTYLIGEGVPDSDFARATVLSESEIKTPHLTVKFDRFRTGFTVTSDAEGHLGRLGEWEYVTERPRGMTSWVLGGVVDPPKPLVSRGFSVQGSHRNEGTDLPGGSSFAYVVTHRMEVPGTQSTVNVKALVHALEPRIDFEAEVDWREIGDEARGIPGLYIDFCVNTSAHSATYETPFGFIQRDLNGGEEVPTLRFAHIPENGLTILQDSKYGHSLRPEGMRMRIVRSSFDPDHAPEVAKSKVRYSVYFHDAEAAPEDLAKLGAAWNHPLIVFPATLQNGDLPLSKSFVSTEDSEIVVTGMKVGEDGGIVLRLANYGSSDAAASIHLDPSLLQGVSKAEKVDLMERPTGSEVVFEGDALRVTVPASSFLSVKLS
jgi:alpha-mannosidase